MSYIGPPVEKLHPRNHRVDRWRLFGPDYSAQASLQDEKCAICGGHPESGLAQDHDHQTDQFRALLCNLCNSGIGCFRDDPHIMEKAMRYVEFHNDRLREPLILASA